MKIEKGKIVILSVSEKVCGWVNRRLLVCRAKLSLDEKDFFQECKNKLQHKMFLKNSNQLIDIIKSKFDIVDSSLFELECLPITKNNNFLKTKLTVCSEDLNEDTFLDDISYYCSRNDFEIE